MITQLIVAIATGLGFLLLGGGAGVLWSRRRVAALVYQSGLDQTLMADSKLGLEWAKRRIEQLEARLTEAEAARVRTVEAVAIAERNGENWKEKYFSAALGHSVAQQVMMREINRLFLLGQRAGIKNMRVSDNISQVMAEFEQKHVAPIPPEEAVRIMPGTVAKSD